MQISDLYKLLFGRKGMADGSVIEMAEHGRAGGLSSEQGFKYTREINEKTVIDEVSASTTYVGKAKQGSATSSASWQIKKISVSSTVTTIAFADGNDNYDNVFDDRTSLSYS